MAQRHEGFSVEPAKWEVGQPADRAKGCGDSEQVAGVLLGAVLAKRAQEGVWGNGEYFAGADLVETAARFLVVVAERETRPGGYWFFHSPDQAREEGYAGQLAQLERLGSAAKEYIAGGGKRPAAEG